MTGAAVIDPQLPLAQQLLEARKLARWAAAVLLVGVVPVGAWLAFAPLSAAVVAMPRAAHVAELDAPRAAREEKVS